MNLRNSILKEGVDEETLPRKLGENQVSLTVMEAQSKDLSRMYYLSGSLITLPST